MSRDTVVCFNCGRASPAWAHVCRHCGVPLRPDLPPVATNSFVPTDNRSLVSMAAIIGSILAALLIGLILSSMNPTLPTVGIASPTITPSPEPTVEPSPTDTPVPTPSPTAPLSGTLTFGTGLNSQTGEVTNPTDTFTPSSPAFAHSIALTAPLGADEVIEEVARIAADGTETLVQTREGGVNPANPEASIIGYSVPTNAVYGAWGAGTFEMRVYRGEELIAREQFTLAEG